MSDQDRESLEAIVALLRAGHVAEASRRCRDVIVRQPDNAPAHTLLGVSCRLQGKLAEAASSFAQAIALDGKDITALNELGNIRWQEGRIEEAAALYQRVLVAQPATLGVLINLGNALARLGRLNDAVPVYQRAVVLQPDSLDARLGLASTLTSLGHSQQALTLYREIEQVQPDFPGLQLNFGLACMKLGRPEEAIAHYDRAIALRPDDYMAHNNRGNALREQQRNAEAIASFRRALDIKPDHARAHSNLLLTLNYVEASQEAIYQESLRFQACQAAALTPATRAFPNSREPQRVLRVGYVSADFRRHSVAYFLKALLATHDRERVQVYCYSNVERADTVTADFQALADQWRAITGLPDSTVADQILDDGIDILVDLGGHTGDNRLLTFARKPAPVQVSWLGYPNTTGVAAIDYRLTDEIVDPPGDADALHTETLLRLPGGFLCYRPGAAVASATVALREADAGAMTFGSFNTLSKVTPDVIRVWSEILKRIPESRLLLKSEALVEEGARARLTSAFAAHGVAPERIELVPWIEEYGQHMALYARVDVALDPFPYNGTTTTCEALWMGVPVITLRGNRHAARVGASVIHHAGLTEWIAQSESEYIALATASAADRLALAASRPAIAERVRGSLLTDQARFTTELEDAYRNMWAAWCRSTVP